ncbi:MAG: ribonuclease H family protein [bacterium]|nr:ribonuclease H family protein [bacterium]
MVKKFYAYFLLKGEYGICVNWADCEKKVKGVKGARFQSFNSEEEAEKWLREGAKYESKVKSQRSKVNLLPGIYFDAGTGRGQGVEINVTDKSGSSLLHKVMPMAKINKFKVHRLSKEFTNNYGELLACYYALRLALKIKVKKVFGDSRLVVNFWSKGIMRKNTLPKDTISLVKKVSLLRKKYEFSGGEITHISGDDNPADLGFH